MKMLFIFILILLYILRFILIDLFGIYCFVKYFFLYLIIFLLMFWCLGGFICFLNVFFVFLRIGFIFGSLFEGSIKKLIRYLLLKYLILLNIFEE